MDVNPRKFPQQERARATVEAIIVATAQILTEQGFETLTTVRIAERAGVSVGSLYQYFPNKQALAAAVVDHYSEKLATVFIQTLERHSHRTLAETVNALIEAAFVAHPHEPAVHRMLIELVPRVGRVERSREISVRIAQTIERVIAMHRQEIAPDLNFADAAIFIETILETAVHRTIEGHPVKIDQEKAMDHYRTLIMGYLRGSVRDGPAN